MLSHFIYFVKYLTKLSKNVIIYSEERFCYEIMSDIKNLHIPRWDELPEIDLYMDQVVTLINSKLVPFIHIESKDGENQIITKTMINNYVKNNLVEPPEKKQYSKKQLAKLFAICVLKQVYSLQEIELMIDRVTKNTPLEEAYDMFCSLFEDALLCTYSKKDFIHQSTADDNFYLLKSVLHSCSYKIYVQNMLKG